MRLCYVLPPTRPAGDVRSPSHFLLDRQCGGGVGDVVVGSNTPSQSRAECGGRGRAKWMLLAELIVFINNDMPSASHPSLDGTFGFAKSAHRLFSLTRVNVGIRYSIA